jgi:death-on-curing protein
MWPDIDPVFAEEYQSRDLLESALGRPFHSMGGQDLYPTVIEKAAALFHSMIANHPFQNGNKRTAVVSVDAFLVANGYNLALGNSAMYELATQTASYRQRQIGHEEMLQTIVEMIRRSSVTLAALHHAQKNEPKLGRLYRLNLQMRRAVREFPGNNILAR